MSESHSRGYSCSDETPFRGLRPAHIAPTEAATLCILAVMRPVLGDCDFAHPLRIKRPFPSACSDETRFRGLRPEVAAYHWNTTINVLQ